MIQHGPKERDKAVERGNILRARRELLGRTLRDAASIAGKTATLLSNLENGHTVDPRISSINTISDAYQMSVPTVLDLFQVTIAEIPTDVQSQAALQIGRMLLELPEAQRETLSSYIHYLHTTQATNNTAPK